MLKAKKINSDSHIQDLQNQIKELSARSATDFEHIMSLNQKDHSKLRKTSFKSSKMGLPSYHYVTDSKHQLIGTRSDKCLSRNGAPELSSKYHPRFRTTQHLDDTRSLIQESQLHIDKDQLLDGTASFDMNDRFNFLKTLDESVALSGRELIISPSLMQPDHLRSK